MARIRAVVTLPWTSALPEDVSVNTFHFLTASNPASAGELSDMITTLIAFYNSDPGAAGDPLSEFYSSIVSRAANACTIEFFDLADPEPRQPIEDATFTLGAAASSHELPGEVALCLSFQATPISGVNQGRRRGRVFIGPLNLTAGGAGSANRPSTAFQTALADAGEQTLTLLTGTGVVWSIYSRTGDAMASVANGWVDNEWDILRSRGRRPTSRLLFP